MDVASGAAALAEAAALTRGVVRLGNPFAQAMFGVCLAGLAVALWVDPLAATPIVPLTVAFYLLGFTNRVVVTPQELISFKTFSIHRVPRELITNAEPFVIGEGVPVMWGRRPHRTAGRLESLLDTIPAEPGGTCAVTRRYGLITLALAALATPIAALLVAIG